MLCVCVLRYFITVTRARKQTGYPNLGEEIHRDTKQHHHFTLARETRDQKVSYPVEAQATALSLQPFTLLRGTKQNVLPPHSPVHFCQFSFQLDVPARSEAQKKTDFCNITQSGMTDTGWMLAWMLLVLSSSWSIDTYCHQILVPQWWEFNDDTCIRWCVHMCFSARKMMF